MEFDSNSISWMIMLDIYLSFYLSRYAYLFRFSNIIKSNQITNASTEWISIEWNSDCNIRMFNIKDKLIIFNSFVSKNVN